MKFKDVKVGQRFLCNHFEMEKIPDGSRKRYNEDKPDANAVHTDIDWPVRLSPDREVELIETKEESE